jgi:cystathionine beta-lyase/cystathionine gamma-synthase
MISEMRTRAVRDGLTDSGVHAVPIDLATHYPSRSVSACGHRIVGEPTTAGVLDKLIRLSVGLKGVEDLWHDLSQAFKAC